MSRVPKLGTVDDREQRTTLARKDDEVYRKKISDARHLIYADNCAVTNDKVEAILKEHSLTPNAVSSSASNFLSQ